MAAPWYGFMINSPYQLPFKEYLLSFWSMQKMHFNIYQKIKKGKPVKVKPANPSFHDKITISVC